MNLTDEFIRQTLQLENALDLLNDIEDMIDQQLATRRVRRDEAEMMKARIWDFLKGKVPK